MTPLVTVQLGPESSIAHCFSQRTGEATVEAEMLTACSKV